MKKYLIISLFCLLHVNLFAMSETEITSVMREKINYATTVLQKKEMSIKDKGTLIFKELDKTFDFALMARLSLGKYWNNIDSTKQKEFISIFETYMKKSYLDKLDLYTDERISVEEAKKIKDSRIWLHTKLHGEKETFDIIYKFYETPTKEWLIYDVDIIGVSIIKTYKAQFEDTIVNNSYEYLVQKIQNIQ